MEGKFFEFMYNCPFFHGKISKQEAKKILQGKPDGSFLIRQKESTENSDTQFEIDVELRIASGKVCFASIIHKIPDYYDNDDLRYYVNELAGKNLSPIIRPHPFSLKELSGAKIRGSGLTEEDISQLKIPLLLKKFLKE